jgi:hydrogenase expression/formation protein HypC
MCLAIPGRVESVEGDDPLGRVGRVDFGGVRRVVHLAYVPEARVGDWVIVHVGFAIARLDEAEARRSLELLREVTDPQGRHRPSAPEGSSDELP